MDKPVMIFNKINGIRFYTDIRTGRSGINEAGLAILCDKHPLVISRLIKSLKEGKYPKGILLREELNVEDCLIVFKNDNEIYCNHELSIAIIFHYGVKNPDLSHLLLFIIHRGFNQWVADITGWKRMYRRFDDSSDEQANYHTQMERNYQTLRDKAFLESCLSL